MSPAERSNRQALIVVLVLFMGYSPAVLAIVVGRRHASSHAQAVGIRLPLRMPLPSGESARESKFVNRVVEEPQQPLAGTRRRSHVDLYTRTGSHRSMMTKNFVIGRGSSTSATVVRQATAIIIDKRTPTPRPSPPPLPPSDRPSTGATPTKRNARSFIIDKTTPTPRPSFIPNRLSVPTPQPRPLPTRPPAPTPRATSVQEQTPVPTPRPISGPELAPTPTRTKNSLLTVAIAGIAGVAALLAIVAVALVVVQMRRTRSMASSSSNVPFPDVDEVTTRDGDRRSSTDDPPPGPLGSAAMTSVQKFDGQTNSAPPRKRDIVPSEPGQHLKPPPLAGTYDDVDRVRPSAPAALEFNNATFATSTTTGSTIVAPELGASQLRAFYSSTMLNESEQPPIPAQLVDATDFADREEKKHSWARSELPLPPPIVDTNSEFDKFRPTAPSASQFTDVTSGFSVASGSTIVAPEFVPILSKGAVLPYSDENQNGGPGSDEP